MQKIRAQRPSADMTRKRILQAALILFMQHGFAGTSMGQLAKKARVNQALIFHHFGNKEKLWRQVKIAVVESAQVIPISKTPSSITEFITSVFEQRITLYRQCPKLKRLVSWQRLESSSLLSVVDHPLSPSVWIDAIHYLQEKKKMSLEIKPDLLMIWLINSVDGYLNDDLGIFRKNPLSKESYISMIVAALSKGLTA